MFRFISKNWQRRADRKQKSKSSKHKVISESNATITKLTDMNDDCLVHIFLYLSLKDLLNIVHTNKQLRSAADLAFERNFGRGKLVIFDGSSFTIRINELEQVQLPNSYRLLCSFGHLILRSQITRSANYMLKYINKYCQHSTTEISFSIFSSSEFYRMKKSFFNTETVHLDYCNFGLKFLKLNKLFPNVRNLFIDHCYTMPFFGYDTHFPHLNQLEIWGSYSVFRVNSNSNLLRLNPQLRRLILNTDYDPILLQAASQHLQFLEYLHITHVPDLQEFGEKVFNFAHLKELKITHIGNMSSKIPISSSSLEQFSFHLSYSSKRLHGLDIIIDFLKKTPSITKVIISSNDIRFMLTINKETLIRFIEAVSSMEEIDISLLKISVNDAIQFVKNCNALKKLCFKLDDNVNFDRLKARLGVKWEAMSSKSNESEKMNVIKIVFNG